MLQGQFFEQKFEITKFKRMLYADPEEKRKHDLAQFFSREGGLRTVRVRDIIILK